MKKQEYYTAKELAEKLKVYKIGKELRIDKKEFQRFLEKAKTK